MTETVVVETRNAIEEMLSLPVARKPLVVHIEVDSERTKKSLQALNDYLGTPKGLQEVKEAMDRSRFIPPRLYPRLPMPCMPSRQRLRFRY